MSSHPDTPPTIADGQRCAHAEASPKDELALAVVRWDGASEDGCSFCGGEWRGGDRREPEPFILHADGECPVVAHRMALIEALIDKDPAPDTDDGKLLRELATAQERWEKAKLTPPSEDDDD